jgi:hypothetical protein
MLRPLQNPGALQVSSLQLELQRATQCPHLFLGCTAAVCHGPVAFANATANGTPIVKGKKASVSGMVARPATGVPCLAGGPRNPGRFVPCAQLSMNVTMLNLFCLYR